MDASWLGEVLGVRSPEDLFDSERGLVYKGLLGVDFNSVRAVLGMNLEYSLGPGCGTESDTPARSYNAVTVRLECAQVSAVDSRVTRDRDPDASTIITMRTPVTGSGYEIRLGQSRLQLVVVCGSVAVVGCSPHWLE